MKIRSGFVSNSSSSSFAIGCPAGKGTKVTIEVDLADLGTVLTTVEECEAHFREFWGGGPDDEEYKQYGAPCVAECRKVIEAGGVVVVGWANSDGDGFEVWLYNSGLRRVFANSGVTIIQGE